MIVPMQLGAAAPWRQLLGLGLCALLVNAILLCATIVAAPALNGPDDAGAFAGTDRDAPLPPIEQRLPAPPLPPAPDLQASPGQLPRPLALRDDVWLVETRDPTPANPGPDFYRYSGGRRHSASLAEFLAANEDGLPLCIWIHGYQICPDTAEPQGLAVYEQMRRHCPPGVHFRFVIWSWPSIKSGPYCIDAKRKARRSDVEGLKLARLIRQLPPHVPVGLLGFSFGARATGATLHFLGGGRIANMVLCEATEPELRPVRAVLFAGALDHDAFSPSGLHSQAASVVDCVWAFVNRCDPVLLAYRHLESFRGTVAMGHTGPVGVATIARPGQFITLDATARVLFSHDWRRYVNNPKIMGPATALLLFADCYQPLGCESVHWLNAAATGR